MLSESPKLDKRKSILPFILASTLFFLLINDALAQSIEKYFNDTEPKDRGLIQTSVQDGEFMIIGGNSFDEYGMQPSILKIDTEGNVIWTTTTSDHDLNSFPVTIRTLVLSNGFIYAVCAGTIHDNKQLWKVNASTGDIVWKKDFISFSLPKHLIDYNETTLLISHTLFDGFKYTGKITFVNKADGTLQASYTIRNPFDLPYGLAIDQDKNIYYSNADSVYKIAGTDPSVVLWKTRYSASTILDFRKIYVDQQNKVFLFGMRNTTFHTGKVLAIDPVNGNLLWDFTVPGNDDMEISDFKDRNGSIYATWKHIYVGGNVKNVWTTKVDKSTGAQQWISTYSFQALDANPITTGGEAALALELDNNDDVLLTGYFNSPNYGPATWGILKLNGNTGNAIYERTVPQNLNRYHKVSAGVSIYVINGKSYFLGNLETFHNLEQERSATALVELVTNGDVIVKKMFYGKYKFPSKTIRIEQFQNKALILKQIGRFTTIGLYDENINPVWETELKKSYMLLGNNLAVTPDNRIVISAYVSRYVNDAPYHLSYSDSLYTFVLNASGQVIQENRFDTYDNISEGKLSATDVYISGNKLFAFYQLGENYYVRKIEGQSVSEKVNLDITYNYSPRKLVFQETTNKIRILGVKNGVGVKLIEIDKNTMGITSTVTPLLLSRINGVLPLNGGDIIAYGVSPVRSPILRYNLAQSKLIWQYTSTNQGEIMQSFLSNEPNVLLSTGIIGIDIFFRKTDLTTGAIYNTHVYPGSADLKELGHESAFNPIKNKVTIAGYQHPVNGTDSKSVFIDVLNIDGTIQDQVLTRTGAFPGHNEAFCVKAFSDGNTWVGGNLNHTTFGKAGFVYKLNITPASQCTTYSNVTQASICSGESYMFGGVARTQTGVYAQSFITALGCDSLQVLRLEVSAPPTVYNRTAALCAGGNFLFGSQVLTEPGFYEHTFQCDSLVRLTLSQVSIDKTVSRDGLTVISNQSDAMYQWYNSDTNTPITGAEERHFTPVESGSYSVKITKEDCSEDSESVDVLIVGVEEETLSSIRLYPNPATQYIILEADEDMVNTNITLHNVLGQRVYDSYITKSTNLKIDVRSFPSGYYVLKLTIKDRHQLRRVLIK